jgi:hypothetical protein
VCNSVIALNPNRQKKIPIVTHNEIGEKITIVECPHFEIEAGLFHFQEIDC